MPGASPEAELPARRRGRQAEAAVVVTPERRSLSALLSFIAEDRDTRLYPYAPVLRVAARELVAIEARAPESCPMCGGEVQQSERGRPRVYCSSRCRKRAGRKAAVMPESST